MNLAPTNTAQQPNEHIATEVSTSSKNAWLLRGFYLFLVLSVAVVSWFGIYKPITVLPRITLSPGYSFQDTAGASVTSEDFRAGITLYSFTYAGCEADKCPQSVAEIQQVYEVLNQNAPDDYQVSLVTISLDPEADNTAVLADLKAEARLAEDGPVAWHFLSSDALRTKSVVGGGFGMFYDKRPTAVDENDYFIRFEPRYVLVDGLGIIRAYYTDPVPDPDIIARDLDLVLTEARNSTGFAKLGYEAAHLFVCYP